MNSSQINTLFIENIEGSKRTAPETLPLWLAASLSHYDFDRLSDILGISEKKLTRLLSGTDYWLIKEFTLLYTFLIMKFQGIPRPSEFLEKNKISNGILYDEITELSSWFDSFTELKEMYYSIDRQDQTVEQFAQNLEEIERSNIAWTGFKVWLLNYLNA